MPFRGLQFVDARESDELIALHVSALSRHDSETLSGSWCGSGCKLDTMIACQRLSRHASGNKSAFKSLVCAEHYPHIDAAAQLTRRHYRQIRVQGRCQSERFMLSLIHI